MICFAKWTARPSSASHPSFPIRRRAGLRLFRWWATTRLCQLTQRENGFVFVFLPPKWNDATEIFGSARGAAIMTARWNCLDSTKYNVEKFYLRLQKLITREHHPPELGTTFKTRDVFQKHTRPFCHFIPFFFFILHNVTTQYMLSFSVQKLSRSRSPTQAAVYQCQVKSSQGFLLFCYYNLPFLKNINFIRGTFGVFVRSLALGLSLRLSTRRESFLGT